MLNNAVSKDNNSILHTMAAFLDDTRPYKINLCIGAYANENGQFEIPAIVKQVERDQYTEELTKATFTTLGTTAFELAVLNILQLNTVAEAGEGYFRAVQTLGASGALSLVLKILHAHNQCQRVWVSDPSWENHAAIVTEAGLQCVYYPYRYTPGEGVDFESVLAGLTAAVAGDAVIVQVCCHNPTGMDLTASQWRDLAGFASQRNLAVVLDFAYHGLAENLNEDAGPLRAFVQAGKTFFICSSFSKNLGMYNERVGALTLAGTDREAIEPLRELARRKIRASYSMPPNHGSDVVARIVDNPAYYQQWQKELQGMRQTLVQRRARLEAELVATGLQTLLANPGAKGMFVHLRLTPAQVSALRNQYAIYLLASGRVSIACLRLQDIAQLVAAIADVCA